jgi:hypothetical protein
MNTSAYILINLAWACLMLWQLYTGVAAGNWRQPRIARDERPFAYWSVMALQGLILILFLVKGRSIPWYR